MSVYVIMIDDSELWSGQQSGLSIYNDVNEAEVIAEGLRDCGQDARVMRLRLEEVGQ